MIPTIDETKEIIANTKHANIDIKETISKTVKAGWKDSNYYVLTPNAQDLPYVFEDEGLEYEFLSDSYFDYINKMIEDRGVYIALAYVTDEYCTEQNVVKYGVEDIDDDEDEIYYYEIETWKDNVTLVVPAELEIADEYSDYGILITKENDKLEITFANNESFRYGHGMGHNEINSIEERLDTGHMLIMKLMSDTIVLKE